MFLMRDRAATLKAECRIAPTLGATSPARLRAT